MLSKPQKEVLQDIMARRLAELRALIGEEVGIEASERSRQGAADVGDFADEPVDADLARTEQALIGMHRTEAREVEDALARLAAGHYGLCADCRAPIGFERLKVNPTGRRCEPCQRDYEKS